MTVAWAHRPVVAGRCAQATGRTKTFYLRKLIEDPLEELEDAYLAEHAIEQLRQGRDRIMSSEEFWRDQATARSESR
ncbi:type II toxin-antitoxin system RelB family antitoxin [Vreelandella populi]|uniref:type II toxin-antitoxin system RelB family antitoxin n=1 Tax=Vreelandella populi TaxID=2498858 RepID=UPI003CCA5E70